VEEQLVGKDGDLLVQIRNGCLHDLYFSEAFAFGFRSRGNGCRTEGFDSPMAGSNIIIGDKDEVVVIYQAERGKGSLQVISYLAKPGSEGILGKNIRAILKENGFLDEQDPPP
jgi:hypothetical protein